MFEQAETRARRAAEALAARRRARLADELRAILPGDVGVELTGQGVALSGPGLRRRLVLDSSLRWTVAGLLE